MSLGPGGRKVQYWGFSWRVPILRWSKILRLRRTRPTPFLANLPTRMCCLINAASAQTKLPYPSPPHRILTASHLWAVFASKRWIDFGRNLDRTFLLILSSHHQTLNPNEVSPQIFLPPSRNAVSSSLLQHRVGGRNQDDCHVPATLLSDAPQFITQSANQFRIELLLPLLHPPNRNLLNPKGFPSS